MQRILVIEDDTDINRLLCRILAKAGYETTAAYSGTEAQLRLERETPDMIMLDLMLPGISGEEIIKMARTEMGLQIPILVLSARTALKNKVETITLGADDYITKPFSVTEALARIKANLRRSNQYAAAALGRSEDNNSSIAYGELVLNPDDYTVLKNGRSVELTAKEFGILKLLLQNPKKVYTKAQIYSLIWNDAYCGDENAVNVHMSRLRTKIEDNPRTPKYIVTVWGIGYKLGEIK